MLRSKVTLLFSLTCQEPINYAYDGLLDLQCFISFFMLGPTDPTISLLFSINSSSFHISQSRCDIFQTFATPF